MSLRLVKAVIHSWGCDCMFFFNYNRINAALSNPALAESINVFFGEARAKKLRTKLNSKSPKEREHLIIVGLKEYLAELGGTYSIEYFFKDEKGKKTSHFLIFVSKHPLGYKIMKEVMARESSNVKDGVANFGYIPKHKIQPNFLDNLYSEIDSLAESLLVTFSGQVLSAKEIFHKHNIGTNYIYANYQEALRKLEEEERITTNPSANERRKINELVTFGENVIVTFPEKQH